MIELPEEWIEECLCCGGEAARGDVTDGQALACGCNGWMTVTADDEDGCDCEEEPA